MELLESQRKAIQTSRNRNRQFHWLRFKLLQFLLHQLIIIIIEFELKFNSLSLSLFVVKQLPNLALKKQTNQSSAELGRHELSSAGVDGCKDSYLSNTCCTKTETESKPWWSVHLGATYNIVAVTLISSNGSSELLRGAEVRIGNRGLHDSHRYGTVLDSINTSPDLLRLRSTGANLFGMSRQ